MSLLNLHSVLVLPRGTGSYGSNGRWTEAVDGQSYSVKGSCQPATTRDVQSLDEGRRTRYAVVLYSKVELNSLLQNKNPDRFQFDGRTFEVFSKTPYKGFIKYFKHLAVEVA
jgi:hypothetical protein